MEAQIRGSVIGILFTYNGVPDEFQWMLDREDDGWTIRSLETGMYAGVENWSTSDGSKVVVTVRLRSYDVVGRGMHEVVT